jgi:hypothetical protein
VRPPVEIVLTLSGSVDDLHHGEAWQRIMADHALAERYNALKREHEGGSLADYKAAKRDFFHEIVRAAPALVTALAKRENARGTRTGRREFAADRPDRAIQTPTDPTARSETDHRSVAFTTSVGRTARRLMFSGVSSPSAHAHVWRTRVRSV